MNWKFCDPRFSLSPLCKLRVGSAFILLPTSFCSRLPLHGRDFVSKDGIPRSILINLVDFQNSVVQCWCMLSGVCNIQLVDLWAPSGPGLHFIALLQHISWILRSVPRMVRSSHWSKSIKPCQAMYKFYRSYSQRLSTPQLSSLLGSNHALFLPE